MTRFPSRALQRHLKQMTIHREGYFDKFSAHVQRRPRVYRLGDAIQALQGLQDERVLPIEQVEIRDGTSARSAPPSHAYAPIMHGLNVLLWEQAIRKGEFTSEEKRRVRELYNADAHCALIRPKEETTTDAEKARIKTLERKFDKAALELAELERFEHVRDTAKDVLKRVFEALKERRDTPHRGVMNSALNAFSNRLSHLDTCRENKDALGQVFHRSAKPL